MGEYRGNFGHNKCHQEKQHQCPDHQHDRRIENGIGDFVLEGKLFLQEFGQSEQNLIQRTAGFTGPHHVHVDRREVSGIPLEHRTVGCASTDRFSDIGQQALYGFLVHLVHEYAQGIDEGQAGHEKRRHLPRHQGDIGHREGRGAADSGNRPCT